MKEICLHVNGVAPVLAWFSWLEGDMDGLTEADRYPNHESRTRTSVQ